MVQEQELEQADISTIHSFCQTMLESMPFASQLGLDMQVMENRYQFENELMEAVSPSTVIALAVLV